MTYHCNRTIFLNAILETEGHLVENPDPDSLADFSLWFPYDGQRRYGRVCAYDYDVVDVMDHKRKFHKALLKHPEFFREVHGVSIPETFLSWKDLPADSKNEDDNTDDRRMWFLKHPKGTEGKSVWCYRNLEDLLHFARKPGVENVYVIQREVPNLLLIFGRKFTLRVYVLVLNGQLYIYRRFPGKIHPRRYDPDTEDKESHIECSDPDKIFAFDSRDWELTNVVFPKICQLTRRVMETCFLENLQNAHGAPPPGVERQYVLMGFDFLIDQNFNPWLIEINSYPCLWNTNPFMVTIKKALLNDFFQLVVAPMLEPGVAPTKGDFIALSSGEN